MTAITRRFCQRCRLQKCFSVGMRKEYIMSEEERLNKRHKIEQNRARKRAAASSDDVPGANASKRGRLAHKRSLSNAELSASGLGTLFSSHYFTRAPFVCKFNQT